MSPRQAELKCHSPRRGFVGWENGLGLGDDERAGYATYRGSGRGDRRPADGRGGSGGAGVEHQAGAPAAAGVSARRRRAIGHKARGRHRTTGSPMTCDGRDRTGAGAYADFGPTLAAEMLAEKHALTVSRETLRGWMLDAGLWRSRQQRRLFHSRGCAARPWASWCRSTAASIAGSRIVPSPAACWCSSTMRPAG